MTAKKDDAMEGVVRPGEGAGAKRPHATLDLEATEVAETAPTERPAADASANEAQRAADADGAQAGGAEAAGEHSSSAEEPHPALEGPSRGSGFAPFLTHLAAGLVGGFVALLAADMIGVHPTAQPGLPPAPHSDGEAGGQLAERLTALEQRTAQGLAQAQSAAEQRQAHVAELESRLKGLAEAQSRLENVSKTLIENAGKSGAESRIAKLEERLAALSAAAETDPKKGTIPQLASITGRLADLEASVGNQLTAIKKTVEEQTERRFAEAKEASEAARESAQRLEREVAAVKADGARLAQRVDALKTESERVSEGVRALGDKTAEIKASMEGARGDLDSRLKTLAKTADAVAPLGDRLAALEQEVQNIARTEQSRKLDTQRIVLVLELANLKRVVDRGERYGPQLAELRRIAAGKVDLGALERYKDEGAPTLAELQKEFRSVAHAALDAEDEPAGGSVVDRLIAGAKSVVRIRKISHSAADASTEAVLGRMEAALADARLGDVIEEAKTLPPRVSGSIHDWLAKVEARHAVDRAIAGLEAQLKASLSGSAPAAEKAAK